MQAQASSLVTEAQYLVFERSSDTKHEYYDGEMYAMAGASESHNLIAANITASLHTQLRQAPCRVYQSDMRVKVQATGLNTYPDVVVVCSQPLFADDQRDTLLNPTLIVEVISPSTERYDRGMKFQHYRRIESLRDYVLVAQDGYAIEQYTRQPDGQWLMAEGIAATDSLSLASVGCHLALDEVYAKVEFPPQGSPLPIRGQSVEGESS